MNKVKYFYLLIAFAFLCSCKALIPSSASYFEKAKPNMPYDVIIVPGVPYYADSAWSNVMKARVYWSTVLYKNGVTKNIIYTGSAVYTPYVEAKIMAMYGDALGVAKENIFTEELAEHSTENVYYSYKLAKKLGFQKIALATDPYQSKLLGRYIRQQRLKITPIPANFDTLMAMPRPEPKIEKEKAIRQNFVSIVNRESKWKRFKGTLGKNVNRKLYD